MRLPRVCLFLLGVVVLLVDCCHARRLLDSANVLYTSDRIVEALDVYRAALEAGENRALVYFNMGNAYYRLDSTAKAIVSYRSCLAAAPSFFKGYMNLAVMYFSLEDEAATIATLRRGLRIEPGNVRARMLLGAAYRNAGSLADAAACFERVVEIDETEADAYLILGEVYRELGDLPKAMQWLKRYPKTGNRAAHAYLLMADIGKGLGDIDKALFYLNRAFNLQPQGRWTLYRIAAILKEQGRPLVALEEVRRGLQLFPGFAELALLGGNIAFEQNLLVQAERLYEVAKANGSADAIVGLENVRTVREERLANKGE